MKDKPKTMWRSAGGNGEWYTPSWIFDALNLTFDLDPCSPGLDQCAVPARRAYTKHDNGLILPWTGTVWMNPPYGAGIHEWTDRLISHNNGIALVFARTDARWFQRALAASARVCFIDRRVRFHQSSMKTLASNNGGAGSVLLAYGETATKAVKTCKLGATMVGEQR